MLQPLMHILTNKRIVLASGSPRRKEILENIGLKFEIIASTFEENLNPHDYKHACDFVKDTARGKAVEVANRLSADQKCPDLIIGADTVVTMDDQIYGKPKSREDAFTMLSKFSGMIHTVYTGVTLVMPQNDGTASDKFKVISFHEGTDVKMAPLSVEIIQAYIDTNEPMDKAGGYGIQSLGGTLVEGIRGDYFNVMGFPLHHFSKELCKIYAPQH